MVDDHQSGERAQQILAQAAIRAASWPHLFGHTLSRYSALNRLGEQELCALLKCDLHTLNRLRLCGRPDTDSSGFALDVQRIAERLGLNPSILASISREVEVADAFTNVGKQVPFSPTFGGVLKAARDRDDQVFGAEEMVDENDRPDKAEDSEGQGDGHQ